MISLLVVNYRSAALAVEAIRSARAASSVPLQVVVVENTVDEDEIRQLRSVADEVIVPARNTGYAGGINLGRRSCSGDVIIACNPDVVFGVGAIDALAAAFSDRRVAVAGPALYWDRGHRWILPPADGHSFRDRVDQVLASRSRAWFHWRDRRRFRDRVRFWSLTAQRSVPAISGAVMAMRAADFDAAGGFDERYDLYFEETDYLRRVRGAGKRVVYVPGARCRHLYNQSAGIERDHAGRRYAESEARFLEKWYGPRLARTLQRFERPLPAAEAAQLSGPLEVREADVVVEASPLPSFVTAAGHFAAPGLVELPPEVRDSYRGDALYLRLVQRDTGRVLAAYAHRKR